jgi:chemotaxis signal transduction protein
VDGSNHPAPRTPEPCELREQGGLQWGKPSAHERPRGGPHRKPRVPITPFPPRGSRAAARGHRGTLLAFHSADTTVPHSTWRRSAIRTEDAGTQKTRGLLTFRLGEFGFGVRVEEVGGLVDAERVAPLPHQGDGLAGVVAFRGDMVPVIHLSTYLGLEAGPAPGSGYALVLGRGSERFGLLVPELPRLVAGRDLRAGEVSSEADNELDGLIECVFQAGEVPYHCLNYWRMFDSIVPPRAASAPGRAARH